MSLVVAAWRVAVSMAALNTHTHTHTKTHTRTHTKTPTHPQPHTHTHARTHTYRAGLKVWALQLEVISAQCVLGGGGLARGRVNGCVEHLANQIRRCRNRNRLFLLVGGRRKSTEGVISHPEMQMHHFPNNVSMAAVNICPIRSAVAATATASFCWLVGVTCACVSGRVRV